jgi:hypothetical protein
MSSLESSLMRYSRSREFALGTVLAIYSVAAQSQTQELSPAEWPVTVQDTVRDIPAHMSAEERMQVRDTKREDLIRFHLGWGTGIRNRYGFWRGNEKLRLSACGHPCHPEDASMKIMEAVWDELHK